MIAVSACLLGYKCRYDGKNKENSYVLEKFKSKTIIPICPETLGGLPVPRDPSCLVDGNGFDVLDGKAKVVTSHGADNTEAFVKGAYSVLSRLKLHKIDRCLLKNKSPS